MNSTNQAALLSLNNTSVYCTSSFLIAFKTNTELRHKYCISCINTYPTPLYKIFEMLPIA